MAEEDDLDALLDGVLEDMSANRRAAPTATSGGFDPLGTKAAAGKGKKKKAGAASVGASFARPNENAALAMEQMAQQLQAMMGELGANAASEADAGAARGEDLEAMMRTTMAAMASNGTAGGGGGVPAGLGGMRLPGMERAMGSGDGGTGTSGGGDGMADLLKGLDGLSGLGGDDIGEDLLQELTNSGDGINILETMMQQMLSKAVLHQPLVDMGAKYPEWLAANAATTSAEEMERYRRQHGLVQQLIQVYETAPEDYTQITALLQEMQECGQPPQELLCALAPGASFGADGMPTLPPEMAEQCYIA